MHSDHITAIFFKSAAVKCGHAWSAILKTDFLGHWGNGFPTIIHDYARWSLTRNRKQKNMSNFWPNSYLCKDFIKLTPVPLMQKDITV